MRHAGRIARILFAGIVAVGGIAIAVPGAHASTKTPIAKRGVMIAEIWFNSPGPDNGTNKSLNGEWVKVKNVTGTRKNITGWILHDSSSHRYTFPRTVLAPHATLRVHTGRGTNDAKNRYWGSTSYIWNNSGDTARLANANALIIDHCTYSSRYDSVRKFC